MNRASPGKVRKNLKSIAKTRPVDVKVGKRGITRALLLEVRKPLDKDGIVKVSLNSKSKSESIKPRNWKKNFRPNLSP